MAAGFEMKSIFSGAVMESRFDVSLVKREPMFGERAETAWSGGVAVC